MSKSNNEPEANQEVLHNVYFDGKVKSLALQTERGKATVGVMKKGAYQFSTSSTENIVVISGILKSKLPGGDWITYAAHEGFGIAAHVVFDVISETDVAYICYYSA